VKHTEGPWTYYSDSRVDPFSFNPLWHVQNFDKAEYVCENMTNEANAALIAAAPDLLAACKLVAHACDSLMAEACGHGVTKWGAVNDMLCAIRSAIARAEGK
jgi:hypothetical protein